MQRAADGVKILLDVAKEASDVFPPLKSALGGVNALIKHYEVRPFHTAASARNSQSPRNTKTSRRRPTNSSRG